MERNDKTFASRQVDIEQKRFFFDVKENQKGKYLRITERSGGRSSIVVPLDGLNTFKEELGIIINEANSLIETES